MAVDDRYERKRIYEQTGKWPSTSKQEKEAIAKNKRHSAISEKFKNSNLSWLQDYGKNTAPEKPEEPEQPTLF